MCNIFYQLILISVLALKKLKDLKNRETYNINDHIKITTMEKGGQHIAGKDIISPDARSVLTKAMELIDLWFHVSTNST